ncbi:MAG TPA: metallophosphoesterase [Anaeromyxobacteraceae bacterium]|nr:metallophosphoesterase [Anaeromyxobacteraceae bacterium]
MTRTLAHISDLHIGRDPRTDAAAAELAAALVRWDVDDVLLTGDVTHRGRGVELALFERLFAPLAGRLTVVPGNHDRAGDAARALMPGARVQTALRPGLVAVRLDSTAPHNTSLLDSHGLVTGDDLDAVEAAVASAPEEALVALLLHHHPLPLPYDNIGERLVTWLGRPYATALPLGADLIARLRGRCDLVLHGHKHRATDTVVAGTGERPLHVMNAGASGELGRARVIEHAAGRVLRVRWFDVAAREGAVADDGAAVA